MKTDFILAFSTILGEHGDMFFSTGNIDQDYSLIEGTIKSQGYWAGTRLRYFFDEDFRLTKTEERVFGK
jgi:hypothetical protein